MYRACREILEKIHPEIKDWYSNQRAGTGFDIFGPGFVRPQVVAEVTAHEPIRKTKGGSLRFGAQQHRRMQEIIGKLLQEKNAKKYLFVLTKDAKTAVMYEFETPSIQVISVLDLWLR